MMLRGVWVPGIWNVREALPPTTMASWSPHLTLPSSHESYANGTSIGTRCA